MQLFIVEDMVSDMRQLRRSFRIMRGAVEHDIIY